MKLEQLAAEMVVTGIVPDTPVSVIAVRPTGRQAAVVTFRHPDGRVDELVVYRDQEAALQPAVDLI